FREGLLRERRVGAHAEDLDVQGLEALVVGLPGQQVRRSGRMKVPTVELEEYPLLAPKLAERDVDASGARELEVGSRLSHFHRGGGRGDGEGRRDNDAEYEAKRSQRPCHVSSLRVPSALAWPAEVVISTSRASWPRRPSPGRPRTWHRRP